ncbi:NucA/NucB deoxyribonuclease domain-containing protein [Streptomyces sp. NPDC059070]|uniref:NucA/NucB deoxyribonuclease domain-containing protein n=1 Tax=Streptomyces sp. NPDC059070 TaxID=3346713 RepID=UPI0036929AAD
MTRFARRIPRHGSGGCRRRRPVMVATNLVIDAQWRIFCCLRADRRGYGAVMNPVAGLKEKRRTRQIKRGPVIIFGFVVAILFAAAPSGNAVNPDVHSVQALSARCEQRGLKYQPSTEPRAGVYICSGIMKSPAATPEQVWQHSGEHAGSNHASPRMLPDTTPWDFPTDACVYSSGRSHDRFTACWRDTLTYEMVSTTSGTVVGHASAQMLMWIKLHRLDRKIEIGQKINIFEATGTLAEPGIFEVAADRECFVGEGQECKQVSSNIPADKQGEFVPISLRQPLRADWVVQSVGGDLDEVIALPRVTPSIQWEALWPGQDQVQSFYGYFADTDGPRCDSAAYIKGTSGGCVFPSVVPTMYWDLYGPAPENAAHIKRAQEDPDLPHWGVKSYGNGHQLNRAEPGTREKRSAEACREFFPVRTGDQCDEFPFGSTYEGGAGASIDSIPEADNRAGGAIIGNFYDQQRVLVWDPFWVATGWGPQ